MNTEEPVCVRLLPQLPIGNYMQRKTKSSPFCHSFKTSSSEATAKYLEGKQIVKVIVVPGRIVNIVVK